MRFWVLDAFQPGVATWSGQVISSAPGPSGGPFMTHLLPRGGVPRPHRARSPVPPRLPLLATPRSVHHLAAVAAGAYPPRRPPNAWSPGGPAPAGRCYWLVTSGTPLGRRGGCLAAGLVCGAVRHHCLGGRSALFVCARHWRPVRGGWSRWRVLCLPRHPLPAPRFLRCVWRVVLSGCPLSSLAGTPLLAVCAFRGLRSVALLPFPACPLGVHALALSRRLPPPSPSLDQCGARTSRGSGVGAGRAVPRGPCPSACPASVLCPVWLAWGVGGEAGSRSPRAWLGVVCAPLGGPARPGRNSAGGAGGGEAACVPSSPEVRLGGPEGHGVALPRSVPLPFPGRQQSGCHLHRTGHGGPGPHTALVRVRVLSPGVVRVTPLCAGAGSLACRGSRGSTRVGAWGRVACGLSSVPLPGRRRPFGGRGAFPPALGGMEGRRPRGHSCASRGPEGGSGGRAKGGLRRGSRDPSSGGVACVPRPRPAFIAGASPPGIVVWPRLFGSPWRRARPGGPPVGQSGGGGWAGRCANPPRGLGRGAPQGGGWEGRLAAVCLSALPGRAPRRVALSLPCLPHCIGSRPSAAVPLRPTRGPLRAGAGLPACRGHCGSGWAADWRHAAYGSACRGSGAPFQVSRPSRGGGPPPG